MEFSGTPPEKMMTLVCQMCGSKLKYLSKLADLLMLVKFGCKVKGGITHTHEKDGAETARGRPPKQASGRKFAFFLYVSIGR